MLFKILSISQRQGAIKLIEKKTVLNDTYVDTKIFPKAISNKLKAVLPTLISSEQTASVKNRFIAESGKLISDVIELSDWFNIEGFLVTMDIEKAFDSLDHDFLSSVLTKFGFGTNFITRIEYLMKDQLSFDI